MAGARERQQTFWAPHWFHASLLYGSNSMFTYNIWSFRHPTLSCHTWGCIIPHPTQRHNGFCQLLLLLCHQPLHRWHWHPHYRGCIMQLSPHMLWLRCLQLRSHSCRGGLTGIRHPKSLVQHLLSLTVSAQRQFSCLGLRCWYTSQFC